MTGLLIALRRKLVIIGVFTFVPGMVAFLFARQHTSSVIQASGNLDIDGLRTPQAVIDIGKVWSGGASIQREFTLENRTGHKITIESVASDCGCTVPKAVSGEVQNGESTNISVVFWPPTVADDQGGQFRRTITVVATTIKGRKSISLALTGFVEPDASLRVFPVNVDVEATTRLCPILHFKGSASLLASIPNTLLVSPGCNKRVLLESAPTGHAEPIRTKDVEIGLTPNVSFRESGDWVSAITFAPDQLSDGLTVHVRGKGPQSITASPASVILTDDPAGQDAFVHFSSRTGCSPLAKSVETDLPLAWDFVSEQSNAKAVCTLRISVRKRLSVDTTGTLRVRVSPSNAPSETISIPVVILHYDSQGRP
jgi:hypothetical protein